LKLWQLARQAGAGKARGHPGAEFDGRLPWFRDGFAQDLADFFFHAPAVLGGALLSPRLDIVFNVANHDLSHRRPRVLCESEGNHEINERSIIRDGRRLESRLISPSCLDGRS
jgi:hypothetical protein